ncbi:21236_t:CDS:2, partial [Entrophospora sp. SA101]
KLDVFPEKGELEKEAIRSFEALRDQSQIIKIYGVMKHSICRDLLSRIVNLKTDGVAVESNRILTADECRELAGFIRAQKKRSLVEA